MSCEIKWALNKMPKTEDKNLSIMSVVEVKKARAFHESIPQGNGNEHECNGSIPGKVLQRTFHGTASVLTPVTVCGDSANCAPQSVGLTFLHQDNH